MAIGKSNATKIMEKNIAKAVTHYNSDNGSVKKNLKYGTSTDEVAPYITYRTYDYAKFKTMRGNRKVAEKRVTTIMESIKQIGRLPTPIIVNEKMEIIEGQGRVEACKRLGLPIEYIIVVGATIEDCRVINQANTPWGEDDYIQSHIQSGNENYIRVKGLQDIGFTNMDVFNFSYNYLQSGAVKRRTYSGGQFILTEETFNYVKENAETILSFTGFAEILGVRREQVQACVYWLMRHKNIDIERLRKNIGKLEMIETTSKNGSKVSRTYVEAYSAHVTDKVKNLFEFIVNVYNKGYAEKKHIKVTYDDVVASRVKASYGKMENLV